MVKIRLFRSFSENIRANLDLKKNNQDAPDPEVNGDNGTVYLLPAAQSPLIAWASLRRFSSDSSTSPSTGSRKWAPALGRALCTPLGLGPGVWGEAAGPLLGEVAGPLVGEVFGEVAGPTLMAEFSCSCW